MTTKEEIIAATESLSEDAKLEIVDSLLASVYGANKEVDEAWKREIKRRMDALDSGEATLIPGEEVLERARRRLSTQ